MNLITQWGLEVIHTVQQAQTPALDAVFRSLTALGSKDFFFVLLPLLLWGVDIAAGARVATAFLFATYVNIGLKDLFQLPRPFALDPAVQRYDVEGYGLPSGHAQLSVVIWGTIAHAFERAWLWGLAGLLALLIGFSRIYLGVHFPSDVLGGWLIGAVLLAVYVVLRPGVERWLDERGLGAQLAVVVVLSLGLLLLHTTDDTASLTGVLLGAGVGLAVLRRVLPYQADGPLWKRAARFLLGISILLALRYGLKAVSPQSPPSLQLSMRFARYAILGLWIGLGAPWLFHRVDLAR